MNFSEETNKIKAEKQEDFWRAVPLSGRGRGTSWSLLDPSANKLKLNRKKSGYYRSINSCWCTVARRSVWHHYPPLDYNSADQSAASPGCLLCIRGCSSAATWLSRVLLVNQPRYCHSHSDSRPMQWIPLRLYKLYYCDYSQRGDRYTAGRNRNRDFWYMLYLTWTEFVFKEQLKWTRVAASCQPLQ